MLRVALGADGADTQRDEFVREAGTALYHACTAIFMASEASKQAPDYRRLGLAHLIARYKLLPRDPLAIGAEDDMQETLALMVAEVPLSLDDALRLLPEQSEQAS